MDAIRIFGGKPRRSAVKFRTAGQLSTELTAFLLEDIRQPKA